ncbi:hypothetical protein EMIHUDRAFT_238963 [Emiliania huxleyi CCMP1516]|uniref:Sulfatase N-terminal domain-containing protein n=3 Tax=Emiliania huxleyi TaxID=2903 RepID=A0A0D3JKV0_EMIH1|nr:hypothetical protein EMIHUDRAFT_238963 [Emiliania huxleyi CCMP1516]EOD24135.1 hypothetical protein EMIHUDRAFT_238963 [Emiliania huxleyi CCMP1516]|eukprot:XP_005776564.1 hypothetical protein EMIHUDRAFT_238963 [Emiliania huxleyi CCMP1516]
MRPLYRSVAAIVAIHILLLLGGAALLRLRTEPKAAPEAEMVMRVPIRLPRPNRSTGLFRNRSKGARLPVKPRSRGPNVALLLADDLQAPDLRLGHTPHVDSIGQSGLRFTNAHTPSPLCTPSRFALLTGRHPSCHLAKNDWSPQTVEQRSLNNTLSRSAALRPIEFSINLEQTAMPTIGSLLQQRGYTTGFIGKWHVGYPQGLVSEAERRRIVATDVAASPALWGGVREAVLSSYRAAQAHIRRSGFDSAERIYINNLYPEQHTLPASMLRHNVEWLTDGAARFLARAGAENGTRGNGRRRPFFLHVAFTLPHNPDVLGSLQADPRWTPGGIWAMPNRSSVLERRAAVCRAANVSKYGHRHYPLALAWLDSGVGEVLSSLRSLQLDSSTLVLFTSDHAAFDKGHCYSGGSRVPLLLRWPGPLPVTRRRRPLPHLVSHLDLLPTLLDLAAAPPHLEALTSSAVSFASPAKPSLDAAPPPFEPASGLRGRSLAPLLATAARNELYRGGVWWEEGWAADSPFGRVILCEVGRSRAAFDGAYRLLYAPHLAGRNASTLTGGAWSVESAYPAHRHHEAYWRALQLYDVAADPAEAHDLLALGADVGEAARRALSLLRAALQAHLDGAFVGSECLAVPAEGSDGRVLKKSAAR